MGAYAPVEGEPRIAALRSRWPAARGRAAVAGGAVVFVPGAAAASLAALLVLPVGLSDGGYFGRTFTALTVALASAAALAVIVAPGRAPSRGLVATVLALVLLAGWIALSSAWAAPGAAVELETRRCVLYAAALGAVCVVVERSTRRAFLLATTGAITMLALVGLVVRAASGIPVDPYYGSLLAEPVGYPNAVGVLVAIGAVLATGLQRPGDRVARVLQGAAALLILVLGLSGSRGGALALVAGVSVLILLSKRSDRWPCVGKTASALVAGGGAWGFTIAAGGAGWQLVVAAVAAVALGAVVPTFGRRGAVVMLCGLALAVGALVALDPPSTTSSFRSAYWAAAWAEARERPLLGSGAGSFYLSWREHRTVDTSVRDAHSLYVETLSELGPVGLALVLVIVAAPLVGAVRRRGDSLVATAAGGFAVFAVHAGIDWDWEMPVVTLVALGCAGTVLAVRGEPTPRRRAR